MKERIIVVPYSLDLARTLASHGKALFNTRILTPVELAQEALMRTGRLSRKEFISRNEELAYYFEPVKTTDYFKTNKLSDLKRINSTINTIRELAVSDEEKEISDRLSKGRFIEKNKALSDIYQQYISTLDQQNKIDTIGLIREAIENHCKLESEIFCIREYPLLPLDLELVSRLTDERYKEISLFDLFEVEEKPIHIHSYKNCYGSSNEVGTIIDDIFRNKQADQCVVACADYHTYAQIFYDYATKYDVPICFGNGLAIVNSYPGKLLRQYQEWVNGNYGWEPFFRLIYSPYFNLELLESQIHIEDEKKYNVPEFWTRVSRLRLTNDRDVNEGLVADFKTAISRKDVNDNDRLEKYLDGIGIVSRELSLPIEEFLVKYFNPRTGNEFSRKFDEAARNSICSEIVSIRNMGLEITDDVIETLLRKTTYRQACEPGHLYICAIDKAASVLGKNMYLCGMSAGNYPGTPKENPLLLDCDLEDFDNDTLTSQGVIRQKRETLFDLVKLASALDNEIDISYPGLNVSELKHNNASSLLFELYKQENGSDRDLDDLNQTIEKVAYFEPALSVSRKIGEAYNEADIILNQTAVSDNAKKIAFELYKYSPSQLNTFFNCRKQYLYQYLLKIPSPEDYDPYAVISATEQGTLVHALMEYLSEHPLNKEDFTSLGRKVFDEYMNISVPLIKDKIDNVRTEFIEMLENGWEMDHRFKREVAFKEEDKTAVHAESGVVIHGYPDRVEFTPDRKAVIIDFKTERDLRAHVKDDIDTCLQVVMYAYIVEKTMGYPVDHCEYRMLRFDASKGVITCKYDDEIKSQLTNKLKEFRRSMEQGDFEIAPMTPEEEKEICRYCKYGSICGKIVIDEEE